MVTTKFPPLISGKRLYISLFLFFSVVINYADRVNLSIAAPAIAKQFHWDSAQIGWLFSAYLWTYAFCLIPGGWLADRYGARRINALAISIWSVAAMLTGAATNFATMVAARLGLGVGEAASLPVCNKVVREWFSASERGFATALFHSGIFVSLGVTSPIVAWLVVRTGWRASFVITGSLGFIWLVLWLRWFQPAEQCSWLPTAEREFILHSRDSAPAQKPTSVNREVGIGRVTGALLCQPSMWGLALTQGCVNYMNYLFLTWLPSYLIQARGMHLIEAGIYTSIPYLSGAILEICFGIFSDRTLTPERIKQGKRRNQMVVLMILSSVVLLVNYVETVPVAIGLISVAVACNTTVIALLYALTSDLLEDPQASGAAFGILLFGGNILGLMAPIVTGYIVKASGSFGAAFALSGALSLIGAVISFAFTRRPIHGPVPPAAEAQLAVGQ